MDPMRAGITSPLDITALMDLARRRWKLLAAITLLVFAVVMAVTLLLTPVYEGVTRLKIDPAQRGAAIDFERTSGGTPDQAVVDTEVSILKSQDIAERVVRALKIENDPEFQPKRSIFGALLGQAKPKRSRDPVGSTASALLGNLKVVREPDTYIVRVIFSSEDSGKAATIANQFAEQYILSNVGTATGTAARRSDVLDERMNQLGEEVRAADAQVAQYRAQAGIVEGGERGTVTDQQIGPISTQLATAESEAAAASATLAAARSQMARGGLDAVSSVLTSGVIADLRRQRAEVGRQQAEVSTRYGPRHPETIRVEQQLAGLDAQIDAEARRIVSGLESDARAASARAGSLRSDLGRVKGEQAGNTRAAVVAKGYERLADAKRTIYNQIAQAQQQTDSERRLSEPSGRVIEAARPSGSPAFPNKPLFGVLGLFAGLIAGAAVVLLAETLSNGIRTIQDVETGLGATFLASVPQLSPRQLEDEEGERLTPWQFIVAKPMSAFAEAYRSARNALLLPKMGERPRIISIASALPGEGKTSSAVSLARVMAMSGDKVVLVDCDLRRNGLRDLVRPPQAGGLLEVLDGRARLDQVIVRDAQTGLDVLPLQQPMFTPQDVFGGEGMRNLLAELSERYEYVVLDTPPLLGVADARTLATLSDTVLLVVKWNKTSRRAVNAAISWLELDGAPVAGVMLTMVDSQAEAIGGTYYTNAYRAYYQN